MEFVASTFLNPLFKDMYRDYYVGLCKFNGCEPNDFEPVYDKYVQDEDVLFPYFLRRDNLVVGFIILQYVEEGCGVDNPLWYVVEFYIMPEHRRKGYGLEAVKHFVDTRKSEFFLYVLKSNDNAVLFWSECAYRLHLKKIMRPDLKHDDETFLQCFAP